MWKVAFVIVLAVGQVPAAPQEKYHSAEYPENVRSGPDSRILSGWDARPGQFPHHAALRLVDAAGGVSGCGGSIISRQWVLSAAHCTASRVTLVVRAGVVNLINPQYIAETTEWYNHPTFNDNLPQVVQPNDIALIKLTRPVTYSDVLKPIRVQPSADAFRNYEGTVTIASGHGLTWSNGVSTEVLQWVYLRAIANNVCFSTYGSLITANSICTSFFNVTSQSTCHGDSGGPLIYTGDDGEPTLIGVASFVAGGDWGCHSGLPAGFIRPGPFLSWFTQITGIDYENLEEEEETTTTSTTTTTTTTTTTEAPTTVPEPETTVTVPETTVTEPQTTVTVPTTTPKPKPPTTPAPEKPDSGEETEESEEDSSEESDEDADPELSELLKKLEVLVKVKVKMSKHGVSHHHHHHHNKTISIRH